MMLLALDLATVSGWCAGEAGTRPDYGAIRIGAPSCSLGNFFSSYDDALRNLLAVRVPDRIVYEAPLLRLGFGSKGRTSIDVARKLIGLANHTDLVAHRLGIECFQSTASDVAEYFIGKNRWVGGRVEKKARTIEACRALGYAPEDDNAADAIALWSFACWRLAPKQAPKRWNGPLLGVQP